MPFGITVSRPFVLRPFSKTYLSGVPEHLREATARAAKHCLIILVGGKEVLAEPDTTDTIPVVGDLWLRAEKGTRTIEDRAYVSVGDVMKLAEASGFDPEVVRRAIKE